MNEERTMLGGNKWKIIRTSDEMPCKMRIYNGGVWLCAAKRHGEDLVVSNDLFDFIETAIEQAKPDLPDPQWNEKELAVLGKMLTATKSTGTTRLANIVSRLMTLYAKFLCDKDGVDGSSITDCRLRVNGKPVMGPGSEPEKPLSDAMKLRPPNRPMSPDSGLQRG